VTSFFHEPSNLEALRGFQRLLISIRLPERPLPVWVKGCTTDEEPYAIALVISAALQHPADLSGRLKLLATDLNEAALAVARRGRHPVADVERAPSALRAQFFHRDGGPIEISRELRRCIVFWRHNLAGDPPFPSLDLIAGRNTLIRLNASLQKQLLLGNVETLSPEIERITIIDASQGLYRLNPHAPQNALPFRSPLHFMAGSFSLRRPTLQSTSAGFQEYVALLAAVVQQGHPATLVLEREQEAVRLEVQGLAVEGRSLQRLTVHCVPTLTQGTTQNMTQLACELVLSQNKRRKSLAELDLANDEPQAAVEELQAGNTELVALNEEPRQRRRS